MNIKYKPFKRGDTASFEFVFTAPVAGYDWTGATIDCVLTKEATPSSNAGAAAIRTAGALTITGDTAKYVFQLTEAESKSLVPGNYSIEVQLRQGTNVATVLTGTVKVMQDYVI